MSVTRQTNTTVHMLYRHNDVKSEGDGEREKETDTHGRHCVYECDR